MREGLYKMNFHTVFGTGTGVIYASNGRLRGGNSAFAFVGSYTTRDGRVTVKINTQRYNEDPNFKGLFGVDKVTLALAGVDDDSDIIDLDGNALQQPDVNFKALLTRLGD